MKKLALLIPILLLLAVSAAHAQYEPNPADNLLKCSDTSGSATAQSCTAPAGWTLPPLKGDLIVYYTTTTNTGALTLNFNGSGAAPVQKQGGVALSAGDIQANKPVLMTFDGTNWQLQISGSPAGSGATVYGGACGNAALSAGTISVSGLGDPPTNFACTASEVDAFGPIITHACTVKNLRAGSASAGVNASDGVVTLRTSPTFNGTFTNSALTCTIGTGTTCSDSTHTVSVSAGNQIAVTIVTQASSTVSSLVVYVDCQ